MTRRLLAFSALLGLTCGLTQADKKDDAVALMQAAAQSVDLQSDNAKPFQLDVDFRAQLLVPENGHYTLKWQAQDRWLQRVEVERFHEIRVCKGDHIWTSRNLDFTPLRVSELKDLIGVFAPVPKKYIKRSKRIQVNGVEAYCVEIKANTKMDNSGTNRQVCLDPATSAVLFDEERTDLDYRKKEFLDYKPFRDQRFPTVLKLWENGSAAITATVVSLTDASFDEDVFEPPAGATSRMVCDKTIFPVPIKTPDPAYPAGPSAAGIGGSATVSLTIEPDGSVDNIHVLGSAGNELDAAVQAQLRKWRFKPAMCKDQAIPCDVQVQVNFQPGR